MLLLIGSGYDNPALAKQHRIEGICAWTDDP
jgi:hypothetical protein